MYTATQAEIDDLPWILDSELFGELPYVTRVVGSAIDQMGRQGDPEPTTGQALNVIEEIGEVAEELQASGYKFIGEYRRYRGFARREGDREALLAELSDVVISAMIMFERLEASAEDELKKKLNKIVARGWINKEG